VTVVVATPFTVARKKSDPPSGIVAVGGLMVTDTEDGADGAEGDEAEGVGDVEGSQPVGRNSRPNEKASSILENQRRFRNCDFMARSPIKLSCLRSHAYCHREFWASLEASLFVNFRPGLEKGQWMPSDSSLR
jgi:hypothetical protein